MSLANTVPIRIIVFNQANSGYMIQKQGDIVASNALYITAFICT